MSTSHILAIDQGTTSSRAIVFDAHGSIAGTHQLEFTQHFPADGWVEHDANEIWDTTLAACKGALAAAKIEASALAAIGITNQRETTVVWDRATGTPVANAIVWQDRRTAEACRALVRSGHEPMIQQKTGLVVDAYFSATKLAWLLDNIPGARAAAQTGKLAFGTIDCFLLWRLTGGAVHATDATNAARTLLYDIHAGDWDDALLALFDVPREVLPKVHDSAGMFGATASDILGASVPITGIAGDQQAALVGQACFAPGMMKSTFGTGAFMLVNTGQQPVTSTTRLLTTIAYRLDGVSTYALEGSIFIAGAAVQWLRDGLAIIDTAAEIETLAASVPDAGGVIVVPAFTGLGAPYWDADARGAILGITRDTGRAQIARATLDAICLQTRDLIEAMRADGSAPKSLRVDGGMVVNDALMQRLADVLGLAVTRPRITETTALGAASLAGLGAGLFGSLEEIAGRWAEDRSFTPALADDARDALYESWQAAVARVRSS
ncbi:MAG TPA: glycerol kinase GlpK [Alphaproteobacteria bacterium]|nr:glycerol kinase GlpK [Alphaproteobacteria bacterium]